MSTAIQWTDETWNAITGCTQVSPGCAHCYAKVEHDRRHKAHRAGKQVAPQYAEPFEVVQLHPDRLDAPLRRRKPTRYFVTSGADPFHEDVPDEFIAQLFAVMACARHHTFQLLTKRPERMRELVSSQDFRQLVAAFVTELAFERSDPHARRRDDLRATAPAVTEDDDWPLPNVWLGVSVENQRFADERVPRLAETPAAVRFLSCEPLLGPLVLDFDDIAWRSWDGRRIDWCIVGGESGTGARPFDIAWAESIVEQCRPAGVRRFVKQLGTYPYRRVDGVMQPILLRDSHGGDPDEWPESLRVREFPGGAS